MAPEMLFAASMASVISRAGGLHQLALGLFFGDSRFALKTFLAFVVVRARFFLEHPRHSDLRLARLFRFCRTQCARPRTFRLDRLPQARPVLADKFHACTFENPPIDRPVGASRIRLYEEMFFATANVARAAAAIWSGSSAPALT
jgi:hypothetical protein